MAKIIKLNVSQLPRDALQERIKSVEALITRLSSTSMNRVAYHGDIKRLQSELEELRKQEADTAR